MGPGMGNAIRHVSTALWKPWISVSTDSPTGLDTSRRSFIRRDRQKAPRPLKYCSRIVTNTSREDKGIWKCSTPTCLGNCFRTRRSHGTNWDKPTDISRELHLQLCIKFGSTRAVASGSSDRLCGTPNLLHNGAVSHG
jgi:hypothetical protein